jgi:hypothetical protein
MVHDGCGVVLGQTDHTNLGNLSDSRGYQSMLSQADQRPLQHLEATVVAPLFRPAHPRPDWSPGLRTLRSARPGRSLAIYIIMCGTCDICVSCSEVGGGLEDVHTVSGSLRRTLTMFGHCSGRPTGVLASPFHCSAIVVALLAGREPMPLVLARGVPAIGMPIVLSCAVVVARSQSRRCCRSCQLIVHTSGATFSC